MAAIDSTDVTVKPVMSRIVAAIKHGDTRGALELCDLLAQERILLHDFLAEAATALASWIIREIGEDRLGDAFEFVFEQSAVRQVYSLLEACPDRGLEAAMLARNCWIAHSCSGAGDHGAKFQVLEDEEKFTFVMDPCGSGGRLWRKGMYGPDGFAVTARAHAWSYGRAGFPGYCTHCSVLNELLPRKYLGYPTWPVDPPAHAGDVCRWYVYKNPLSVPPRHFERFGISPQDQDGNLCGTTRYFSQAQLVEMSVPTPDRIRERLDSGDPAGALRICRRMKGEFYFLHNLYVNAIACSLDFIERNGGEDSLLGAFDYIYPVFPI